MTEPQLDQTRWNRLGSERLRALREEPERFVSESSPHAGQLCHAELTGLLEPLQGRRILELGCGGGCSRGPSGESPGGRTPSPR